MLKGCELLGKHLGMFIEKVEVEDRRDKGPITDLTFDELCQRVDAIRAARARRVGPKALED